MQLAYKKTRKRIDARKEAQTQDRIRLGFERSLSRKMINYFSSLSIGASKALEQNGIMGFDVYMSETRPKVARILEPHWYDVIKTFSDRSEAYILRKELYNGFYQELLEKFTMRVGANHISDIDDTSRKQLRRVIFNGQKDGLPLPQIAKNIRERYSPKFSRARAATIARTETHSAASFANHQVGMQYAKTQPAMKKQWIATNDVRTREAHRIANGQIVNIDSPFIVGGRALQYTGDPQGGAANIINCRCAVIYIEPEDNVFDSQENNIVQPVNLTDITEPSTAKPLSIEALLAPAINKSLRGDNLNVRPVKVIKKEFDERLVGVKKEYKDLENILTVEGKPYGTRFTGTRFTFKTSLANLDDEVATVVREVYKELDDLATRFKIPKLNGLYTTASKEANGSMGDGHLMLNYESLNRYSQSIKGLERKKPNSVLLEEIELQNQIEIAEFANQGVLDIGKTKFNTIRRQYGMKELTDADGKVIRLNYDEYNLWWKDYEKSQRKVITLKKKQRAIEKKYREATKTPAYTWKRGDRLGERPWSAKEYFDDGLDQTRSLMYHEFGHHVHQLSQVKNRSSYVNPPVEQLLKNLRDKVRETGPSLYSRKNQAEWFAENFSLYFMDKKDLVAPEFKSLIKAVMEVNNEIR